MGFSHFNSTIRFDQKDDVKVNMQTTSLSAAWLINDKWAVRTAIGLINNGELSPKNQSAHSIRPGGLLTLGIEYSLLTENKYLPYVDFSMYLSASLTHSKHPVTNKEQVYQASDLRFGSRASWLYKNIIIPSVFVRLFGGPVNWTLNGEKVVGSDIHHYQTGLGLAINLNPIVLFTEWAALGEKNLSAGLSYSF